MEEGGQCHVVATLPTGKRHGTLCIGGLMGPRASLDQCGKFCPSGIWSPACPAHSKSACASCGRNYGLVWLLVQECETSLTLYSQCDAKNTECDLKSSARNIQNSVPI